MDQAALTPQQRQAVTYRGGPLMVLAGPGTGKTRTLTHRLAYLVLEQGIPPENILAVTFTNQAAEEMRVRVAQLLPRDSGAASPWITTFHGFSYRLLRQSFFPNHQLLSENEALEVIKPLPPGPAAKIPTEATERTIPAYFFGQRVPPYSRRGGSPAGVGGLAGVARSLSDVSGQALR